MQSLTVVSSTPPPDRVTRPLGEGTYGKVVSATQNDTGRSYAIKIIRAVKLYRDASVKETEILAEIKKRDPTAKKYVLNFESLPLITRLLAGWLLFPLVIRRHCIHLLEQFEVRDHVCLVFEQLGMSIFQYLIKTGFTPLPLDHIRTIGHQLLTAVACRHASTFQPDPRPPPDIVFYFADSLAQTQDHPHGSKAGKHPPVGVLLPGWICRGQFCASAFRVYKGV